jgi:hypothetical protein
MDQSIKVIDVDGMSPSTAACGSAFVIQGNSPAWNETLPSGERRPSAIFFDGIDDTLS